MDCTIKIQDPGMYVLDNRIIKVKKSKTSNRIYATELIAIGGRRLTTEDDVVQWEFRYAPGVIFNLTPAHKMQLPQAQSFGLRYGTCAVCGARLSDARSVAQGLGPICAKKFAA